MDVAVGVWRTIMEKVFFATLSILVHLFVKVHLMPLFNHLRLFDGEVSPHLKTGVRHKQCVFELAHMDLSFQEIKNAHLRAHSAWYHLSSINRTQVPR